MNMVFSELESGVARLVMGCGRFSPKNIDTVVDPLLDEFIASGGRAIDTAHIYGEGASERAIGDWIRRRRKRERLFIITKGCHPDLADWQPRVTPEAIRQDLNESLERLGVDHIDLYLLHRDDPSVDVGPLVESLNAHVAAGRIRHFGASNWSTERIQAANEYATAHGLQGFAASSPQLSLAVSNQPDLNGTLSISGLNDELAWYRETGMPVVAWSSQARGFFGTHVSRNNADSVKKVAHYDLEENWERKRRVNEIAERKSCTPSQVALAWLLHLPINVLPVIGPGTLPHLRDCLGAVSVRLDEEEVAWINLEE